MSTRSPSEHFPRQAWPVHDTVKGSLGKCSDGERFSRTILRRIMSGRCAVGGGPVVADEEGVAVSTLAAPVKRMYFWMKAGSPLCHVQDHGCQELTQKTTKGIQIRKESLEGR